MYDWKLTQLKPTDVLKDAILILEQESLRIVLVVDDLGRLLGTITDGDVRRALLHHYGMEAPLQQVMFQSPTTALIDDDRENILEMMRSKDLLQVPLLDVDGRIVGLETLQHLLKKKRFDNPVFLMAGGFGKRLRPLTNDIPKPLLKVGSKPILQTILEAFVASGFHRFYIATHYKAEQVRDYFGNGDQWGVTIEYIHEEKPLGTAGALGLLPNDMPELPLVMMNGDLLTKVNFEHLLRYNLENGGVATMAVREYDFQIPYGVVKSNGHKISQIVEKPVQKFFVNAGIYMISVDLYRSVIKNQYLDMPDLLQAQIDGGMQINMFPVHEYWLDIGRIEEYERAQGDIVGVFS